MTLQVDDNRWGQRISTGQSLLAYLLRHIVVAQYTKPLCVLLLIVLQPIQATRQTTDLTAGRERTTAGTRTMFFLRKQKDSSVM